jgi:DNA helicase-2/ATP-dependent DNA helicase PcrA
MIKNEYDNQQFEQIFAKLNSKQKAAVEQIEGPVLVIAGPGTGKTQILAARISKILTATDTLPDQILCLTYTDAGTVAMRSRLTEMIGTDAYRVQIHTFHSFCNKVISENQDYFGMAGLEPVSELEQIQFVHEIIDELKQGDVLKRYTGDVYYDTKNLLSLYSNMKKEGWTSEFVISKADAFLERIKTDDAYLYKRDTPKGKKGELNLSLFNKQLERMNRLKSGAATFDNYLKKLAAAGRYDFDDMINWVVKAFQKNETMLLNYQEQFLYFLVDEYQDTSGTQNQMLSLLISYWQDKPNVFCVGDDDQSIFRFQGANVENISKFIKDYQPIVITLDENYRSTQQILDTSRTLISKNTTRLNPDKYLLSSNTDYSRLDIKPTLCEYHNSEHEAAAISLSIEDLMQQGVRLNEIAVIYPKHKVAEHIVKYLTAKNIPYHLKKPVNVLDEILIQQVLHILTYLSEETQKPNSGEHLLYEMLHFDCFQVDSIALAKLSREVELKQRSERSYSWRRALRESVAKDAPDLFNQEVNKLGNASVIIERWIKEAHNITLAQLVEKIINESGMLVKALTHAEKTWYMQVLHTFFDYVKDECARHPRIKISEFIETLQLMRQSGVVLPLQKIAYADDGVQFLTAHSAKGLEFEYVFIISGDKESWDKGMKTGFSYPDNLFTINTHNETEERRRLFYVAMTRAKKHLHISWPKLSNTGKELEPSQFVAELKLNADVELRTVHVQNEELVEFKGVVHKYQQPTASTNLFDNEWVDELLKNYSLSVTHLNNYLKCPTAFYFNNLLRIPAPLSAAMTFGSAVHYALEKLFKKMHETQTFVPATEFVGYYTYYMSTHQEAFTEQEYMRRLEYGELILEQYYNRYVNEWNKITVLERKYSDVFFENARLTGMLDKLEFDGKRVTVVDYKTGKYEGAKKKLAPPQIDWQADETKLDDFDVLKTLGGNYWRQAAFYKLLIEHSPGNEWEVVDVKFDFVEPEKNTNNFFTANVPLGEDDLKIIGKQITASYTRIMNKVFEPGCGEKDCNWCNFVKTYYKGTASLAVNESDEDQE